MKIVVFGLTVTSTWGNGHGTTFRALLGALHRRGHVVTFFEKNVEWYASNRDLPSPDCCDLRLYNDWQEVLPDVRSQLSEADVAMVGSFFPEGIAAIDEMLASTAQVKTFYDIDTPITVASLRARGRTDYLEASQVPRLDIYFSFTGGPMLAELQQDFGAPRAFPLYCSFDPREYSRRRLNPDFECDLSYMGTYSADRQPKIEELLISPANDLLQMKFIVAGPQYPSSTLWPENVRRIEHLNPRWHAEFYSSSRFTLNVTRRDMVMAGYSPSVRLFEAAACGACIISDNWPGLEGLFAPGEEILLPARTEDVKDYLTGLSEDNVRRMGENAQKRVLAEHTSESRARQFEGAIEDAIVNSKPSHSLPKVGVVP